MSKVDDFSAGYAVLAFANQDPSDPSISIFAAMVISIIASLISLFIVSSGRTLWFKAFRYLWLKVSFKQLTDISGRWVSGEVPMGIQYTYNETLEIKQFGWAIFGVITYRETPGEDKSKNSIKLFKLKGIYREKVLVMHYFNLNKKSSSVGCDCLHLCDDDTLKGACAYYDPEKNTVVVDHYTYKRDNLVADSPIEEGHMSSEVWSR